QLSDNLPPNAAGPNTKVYLHFERPALGLGYDPVEVAQADRLQAATGEEIHVFGKDAMGRDYAGIDGTIGDPRRPMQLKRAGAADGPSGVRLKAQEALAAARGA